MADDLYGPFRQQLTELLTERGLLDDAWLAAAFAKVPRHWYVPDRVWVRDGERWYPTGRQADPRHWAELVYHPTEAVVTQVDDGQEAADGSGLVPTSSISSSGAVLNMLRSLDPQPGQRVLEIGTGTGYNAALLCERVGDQNVVSVEIDPALAAWARERLNAARYRPTLVTGDGELGYSDLAPYDRIIATASVRHVPPAWLDQVADGGELVVPWLPNDRALGLMWLRKGGPHQARGYIHGLETFMAVRGQRHERLDVSALWKATGDQGVTTSDHLDLADVDGHGEFLLAAALPGVTCVRQDDGWFIVTADRKSWIRTHAESTTSFGERDLVPEITAALSWWRERNRPRYHDFGVTITLTDSLSTQVIWHDHEDDPVPVSTGAADSP
ncbi:methyltransferase domain-containing protein [Streptomyces sp. TLI_146]|uniref:methyltransferase domain-containing protein n=1 Tax=Streptomyces sp. TLI_146 TaxID=1938858 RepID=UPI000C70AB7D|nr:methyltransferase domain-containing protein [Streptomyces sp. TLI_146]PKV82679.1 protein-L-isoaspartate(D-aspartate) O-methyltransferase [Streptomyces sp. TLI_146]